jgi:PAS domain S-box-containing protein
MISRHLYMQIIIRILLITAVAFGAGLSWAKSGMHFLSFLLCAAEIPLVINLISYLNSTNRKMGYFLEAIQNNDSMLKFPEEMNNKPVRELFSSMNKVNEQIRQLKMESRQSEQYLQTLIEHVAAGIITFNAKGFVLHANTSAKKLLGMEVLTHIQQIERINHNLFQTIQHIRPFDQKLVSLVREQGSVELSLKATSVMLMKDELILLSIQDIRNELDQRELDSWMKLIRVMMHEIMNSIAPITSLSESLRKFFSREGKEISPEELSPQTIDMTIRGLNVIHEQGNGLMHFVESYRKLTGLPRPEKSKFRVEDLFDRVKILYQSLENSSRVKLNVAIHPENIEILADENLISQVLLNLLKNALEAISDRSDGQISLTARVSENKRPAIWISDNGPGIPEEIIEQIFVPFFTTREKGSGIGLSLSRQIMRLHGGTLQVRSVPNKETVFCLEF